MRECTIEREESEGIDILHLDGALDAYSFPHLESALNELGEGRRYNVVLDFENLNYISSAALGSLIAFARRARESHGDLKLANLSSKIYSIVELLGFDEILEIHPKTNQAVQAFQHP